MVTIARTERLTLPLAPALAIAGGVLVALLMLVLPTALLERLVMASGLPAVIAAAEPPLGLTARVALGLILGGGVMAFACVALSLLLGDRNFTLGNPSSLLRRSDVHPDAPPRPPLFATRDLGTPFLEVKAPVDGAAPASRDPLDMTPVEQPLPRDLDRPLSDFDPGAILLDPFPATEAVAPLAPAHPAEPEPEPVAVEAAPTPRPALFDPGDRFETFELTPARPVSLRAEPPVIEIPVPVVAAPAFAASASVPAHEPTPDPVVAPETEATVHDLLARLERGIAARPSAPVAMPVTSPAVAPTPIRPAPVAAPASSLAGTLGDLRRLATGGC